VLITGAFPGAMEVFCADKEKVQIARTAAPNIILLAFILSYGYGNAIQISYDSVGPCGLDLLNHDSLTGS